MKNTELEISRLWHESEWTTFMAEDGCMSIAMNTEEDRVLDFARALGVEVVAPVA